MTLRVYQEDPRRAALAVRVVASAEGWFIPDRTLLHAPSPAYGHAMPPDRGEILAEGHKSKVVKVRVGREGDLVHQVRGPTPSRGAEARLHLDERRRALSVRAHAAAHLLAGAVVAARGELAAFPVTTGGGQVRLTARLRRGAAEVDGLLRWIAARAEAGGAPEVAWLAQADADRKVLAGSPLPAEEVVRVVTLGGVTLACDAPVVRDVRDVGALRLTAKPREGHEGVAFAVRVAG